MAVPSTVVGECPPEWWGSSSGRGGSARRGHTTVAEDTSARSGGVLRPLEK